MRVLVAEDDTALRTRLAKTLGRASYLVDEAADGEAADYLVGTESYDAIVLDLGLPLIDGVSLLRRWREAAMRAPILILTARDTWRDKVAGLRAGADDYMAKPFEAEELLARLEALIRRSRGWAEPVLRIGGIEIDPARRTAREDGLDIDLTAHEFRTLHYLVLNAGRVVPQGELVEHIYRQEMELASNVVEVIVSRIRKKLKADVIQTRRGHGYTVQQND